MFSNKILRTFLLCIYVFFNACGTADRGQKNNSSNSSSNEAGMNASAADDTKVIDNKQPVVAEQTPEQKEIKPLQFNQWVDPSTNVTWFYSSQVQPSKATKVCGSDYRLPSLKEFDGAFLRGFLDFVVASNLQKERFYINNPEKPVVWAINADNSNYSTQAVEAGRLLRVLCREK